MNFVLPIVWAIIFLFIIWKHSFFKLQGFAQWILLSVFFCKLATSGILHFIYTNYYPDRSTADIFKYFDDAVVLFDSLHQSVGDFLKILFGLNCDTPEMSHYFENTNHWTRIYEYAPFLDNRLVIRTNMVLMFVSAQNIAVHYVFANFISFFGCILIYKTFEKMFGKSILCFILIFLMPSTLLWSAGILKECLVIFALGCFVYGFFNLTKHFSASGTIFCIIGLLLLVILKIYVLVALCPALLAFVINKKKIFWKPIIAYIAVCILGVLCIGILDFGLHELLFFESFAGKRTDAINTAELYNAQSIIPISRFDSTPWNFLKETPAAIWNAIALPYIWNFKGVLQFVPALESLLLFILIALVIFFYKKPKESQKNFIWFCIFFSVVLIWEIGISTAVVGGIVRYKIPLFPFLYTTLAMLVDWRKIGIQNS